MKTSEKYQLCPYRVGQKVCRMPGRGEECFSPDISKGVLDPQIQECAQQATHISRFDHDLSAAADFIDSRGNRHRMHRADRDPNLR